MNKTHKFQGDHSGVLFYDCCILSCCNFKIVLMGKCYLYMQNYKKLQTGIITALLIILFWVNNCPKNSKPKFYFCLTIPMLTKIILRNTASKKDTICEWNFLSKISEKSSCTPILMLFLEKARTNKFKQVEL
jgi:hypothetical protein